MRRRRRAIVAGLLVSTLVAAACGGDDDEAGGGDTTTSSATATGATEAAGTTAAGASTVPEGTTADVTTAPEGTTDDAPAPAADADRDATLTLAASIAPSQWDPHLGRSAVVDYSLMGPIYDRLLLLEPDMTVGPMLATSYEMAPDNMSMTLELRDDVTFHDGTPFNAEAVKANLEYTKGVDSFYGNLAQIVENVVVDDEFTVTIEFNADGTNFPLTLAFYTGVGGMVSPTALADPSSLTTTPAGSGPYNLKEQQQDRAIYERVPGYWDETIDAQAPQTLVLVSIADDNARTAALQSGQIDGSVVINPLSNLDEVADGEDIILSEFPNNRIIDVLLNYSDPALANPDVRKALSMAIDREAIAQSVVLDACIPSAQAASEGSLGYSPDATFEYDPEAARELLEGAGVDELSIAAEVVGIPLFQNIGVALQAQWAEIGVNLELTPVVSAESLAEWRSGKYQMYVQTASGFPDPGQLIEDYFATTNMPFGSDPTLIEMQNAAKVLPIGSDERNEAYIEINQYMSENPVNVIICTWPVQVLTTSKVGGVENTAMTKLQTAWDSRNLYVIADSSSQVPPVSDPGRVAFITGGAAGFGMAFGKALGALGTAIVVADIDHERATATAGRFSADGISALGVRCDVAREDEVDAAVAGAVARFGGIDILINNAGLHLSHYSQPFSALPRSDVRDLFDINVMGTINCSIACRDPMRRRGGGLIVNVASVAGYKCTTPYGVSKLAVRGLTIAFATEFKEDGIRVNAIAPGLMATENVRADLPPELFERYLQEYQLIPRTGSVQDVVDAMLFLCSAQASFITGETLRVSGGATIGIS